MRVMSESADYAGAEAKASALASALAAVSDAHLYHMSITFKVVVPGIPTPGPSSDANTYSILFYRNGDDVGSISVPSAGNLPIEASGPYAGIRHTRELVELSGLLSTVEAIASGLADRLGRPYPTTFSVGGRVEL